jgi:hypothetical protein
MKRDLELLRKIVLAIEDSPSGYAPDLQIPGYTSEQIGYHSYLLVDSGYAKGDDVTDNASPSPDWRISHLTSAGHDFADAARNEGIWRKAMDTVKTKAGTVTLDVMKQLLISLAKRSLELP